MKKEILDKESNRAAFNKGYKQYLENHGDICCSRCRYHRGENRKGLPPLSWKRRSKKKKQWEKNEAEWRYLYETRWYRDDPLDPKRKDYRKRWDEWQIEYNKYIDMSFGGWKQLTMEL